MGPKQLLLVETDPALRQVLTQVGAPIANLTAAADFQAARMALLKQPFDIVVTNLRLHTHNGLHLVYLISASGLPTRIIVYTDDVDPFLVREAQQAGALYESLPRLIYSLPAYIHADLPELDRRDPARPDRRSTYRGGRRRSDVALSTGARTPA